jgi:hypothetical protein
MFDRPDLGQQYAAVQLAVRIGLQLDLHAARCLDYRVRDVDQGRVELLARILRHLEVAFCRGGGQP